MHEQAQSGLWSLWYTEYGESACDALQAAEGKEDALADLMTEYPDWVEPANRLATLKYIQGEYSESVQLCLRILRSKPWHFGASSGIVMCYAQLAETKNVLNRDPYVIEANKWAEQAMPPPGKDREEWVTRMLLLIDERLAELKAMNQ